ncbi:MAG: tetratricopeptide repeat protein [Bacteroidia bacterium]
MLQTLTYLFFFFSGCSMAFGQTAYQHFQHGGDLQKKEHFEESAYAFQRASQAYAQAMDWDSACIAKASQAGCFSDLKDMVRARLETDSAAWYLEKGDQQGISGMFELLSQRARLELDAGKPEAARPYMKEGVHLFSGSDSSSRAMRASMLSQLGASFSDAGLLDSAIYFYSQSLEIRQSLALSPEVLGKAHLNLGSVSGKAGDFDARYEHYLKALELYKKADTGYFKSEILYVYNNLGGHFVEKGDFETALPYFNHSLAIAQKLFGNEHPTTANIINNVGFYYLKKGDFALAKKHFSDAQATLEKMLGADHPFTALTMHNLGFSAYYSGEKERGKALVAAAIDILEKRFGTSYPTLLNMYENLGRFISDEDLERGIALLEKARDLRFKALGKRHPRLAQGLEALGRLLLRADRTEEAAAAIQQGIIAATRSFADSSFTQNPELDDAISLSHLMRLLHLKAQVLETQGLLEASSQSYELAIKALNLLRNQVYQASGKASLQEDALSLLSDAAGHYYRKMDQGDEAALNSLFSVVQQGKAALLTDHLRNDRAIRFGGLPPDLRGQELSMQSDLSFYQNKIAEQRIKGPEADSALLARLLAKSLDIEHRQRQLRLKLERHYPDYFELKYNVSTPDLRAVQSHISSDEAAILEFFEAEDRLFAFWITRKGVKLQSLPADTVEMLARQLHNLLRNPGTSFETVSHALFAILIEPFISQEPLPSNLTIVPDGMLGYIPFEVFLTEKPTTNDYRQFPYLGKKCAISYAYAIRLLFEKRQPKNK